MLYFHKRLQKQGQKDHIRFSHTDIFSVKDEISKLLKSKFPKSSQEIK